MCRENLFSLPNTCFLWNKPVFFGGAAKKNAPVNGLLRVHLPKRHMQVTKTSTGT